jgi:hypothetical protein
MFKISPELLQFLAFAVKNRISTALEAVPHAGLFV